MPLGPVGLAFILSEIRIARAHLAKCEPSDHKTAADARLVRAMEALGHARDEALAEQDARRAWRNRLGARAGAPVLVPPPVAA